MGIFDFIDTLKLIQLKHIGAKNACMTQYIMHLRASYISYSNEKLKNIIDKCLPYNQIFKASMLTLLCKFLHDGFS